MLRGPTEQPWDRRTASVWTGFGHPTWSIFYPQASVRSNARGCAPARSSAENTHWGRNRAFKARTSPPVPGMRNRWRAGRQERTKEGTTSSSAPPSRAPPRRVRVGRSGKCSRGFPAALSRRGGDLLLAALPSRRAVSIPEPRRAAKHGLSCRRGCLLRPIHCGRAVQSAPSSLPEACSLV